MKKYAVPVSVIALCASAVIVTTPAGALPTGVTAYTCKEGVGAANTNSHCVPKSEGKFGHEQIGINQEMQLKLNGLGKQILTAEPFLALVELVAEEFECAGCMVENIEEPGEKMLMTSLFGHLKYSTVVVGGGMESKCQVKSAAGTGVIETEPLKFATNSEGAVAFSPASGTTIAKFEIVAVSGKKCNLVRSYTLSGSWLTKPSGATWKTNVTSAEGVLTLSGSPASLSGEATAEAEVTPDLEHPAPEHRAIAFT